MTDLSIIIPIYNTPLDALTRCLSSIDALQNISYEVLLVDDGSGSQVGHFCKEYVSSHPAFHYFYKENGGVSSARNLGITQAQGRYLTFVDADDQILGQVLAQNCPKEDGPDLVFFDILLTQRGNDSIWSALPIAPGPLDREQVFYQLCSSSSISGPVAKLYKSQVLQSNNLRFDESFITGEDWMFVCDCIWKANSFLYCNVCSYQYFREEGTGQSRLARFPDQVLSNQLFIHHRKMQIVQQQPWNFYSPEQVCSLAAVKLIENMFNTASELLLIKQLTPQRKKTICEAVAEAGNQLVAPVHRKTKLKSFVLLRFPAMIRPLAIARWLYLMIKH